MRKNYDFSTAKKNPYAKALHKQAALRTDDDTKSKQAASVPAAPPKRRK